MDFKSSVPASDFLLQPIVCIIKIRNSLFQLHYKINSETITFSMFTPRLAYSVPNCCSWSTAPASAFSKQQLLVSYKLDILYCNFSSTLLLKWLLSPCVCLGWLILSQAAALCLQLQLQLPWNNQLFVSLKLEIIYCNFRSNSILKNDYFLNVVTQVATLASFTGYLIPSKLLLHPTVNDVLSGERWCLILCTSCLLTCKAVETKHFFAVTLNWMPTLVLNLLLHLRKSCPDESLSLEMSARFHSNWATYCRIGYLSFKMMLMLTFSLGTFLFSSSG